MRKFLLPILLWFQQCGNGACRLSSSRLRRLSGDFVDVNRDGSSFTVVHQRPSLNTHSPGYRTYSQRLLDSNSTNGTSKEVVFASCDKVVTPEADVSKDLVLHYDFRIIHKIATPAAVANATDNINRAVQHLEDYVFSQLMGQICNEHTNSSTSGGVGNKNKPQTAYWMLPLFSYAAHPRDSVGQWTCVRDAYCSAIVSGALTVRLPKALEVSHNLTCSVLQYIHRILMDRKTVHAIQGIDLIDAGSAQDLSCESIHSDSGTDLKPVAVFLFTAAVISILVGVMLLTRACCSPQKVSSLQQGSNATVISSTTDEESGDDEPSPVQMPTAVVRSVKRVVNVGGCGNNSLSGSVLDSIPETEEYVSGLDRETTNMSSHDQAATTRQFTSNLEEV